MRATCVSEDGVVFAAIRRPRRRQPDQLGSKKQQAVQGNSAPSILRHVNVGFGRHVGEQIDEQAARNVVPVKRPRVLDRYCVREDRTVAEQLQSVAEPGNDEQHRPAQTGADDQHAQQAKVRANGRPGM